MDDETSEIPLTETEIRNWQNTIRDPKEAIKVAVKAAAHPKGTRAMGAALEALSQSDDLTPGILAATYEIHARKLEQLVKEGATNKIHDAKETRRAANLFRERRKPTSK